MAWPDADAALLSTATRRNRARPIFRTFGAALTGLETFAQLISMADANTFDGDEAVACFIIFASELDVRAVGADASNAFPSETCLSFWANDWLMATASGGIATIGRTEISVIAANPRSGANAAGARVGAGAGVAVVALAALVGRVGKARSVGWVAGSHVTGVIQTRAVDRGAHTVASGVAGVPGGAETAIIAGNALLRNRNAGPGITCADIALVGQVTAFGVQAAIGVDEIAMVGDMLVQRVGADGDDFVGIRRRAGEMADGHFVLRHRRSSSERGERGQRAFQHSAAAGRDRQVLDKFVEFLAVHGIGLLSRRDIRWLPSR